jgi:hypothetical protein
MNMQTPFDTTHAFAGPTALEDWEQATRAVAHRYLELYAATVGRLADAHVTTIRDLISG